MVKYKGGQEQADSSSGSKMSIISLVSKLNNSHSYLSFME